MAQRSRKGKSTEEISYEAYVDNYKNWEKKGYAMDEMMSFSTYKDEYAKARDAGLKNIARDFAHSDIKFTASEARKFTKSIAEPKIIKEREYNPKGKYVDANGDRYDLKTTEFKFSKEELKELREELSFKKLIKMDPGELYNLLRDNYGLSPREAGSVVDEIYSGKAKTVR